MIVSTMKGRFTNALHDMRGAVYESLTSKGVFAANPGGTRFLYQLIGAALAMSAFAVAWWCYRIAGADAFPCTLGIALSGLVVAAFAPAMPAKTARGSRLLAQARGFQRFARSRDKKKAAELAAADPDIFSRFLPHALALGVGKEWAALFAESIRTAPEWFVPVEGWGTLAPIHIVPRLHKAVEIISSILGSHFEPEKLYEPHARYPVVY
jgi:hypothetical protein